MHAGVDKASAVVGEQVTFSIYGYRDTAAPDFDVGAEHEASAADFARQPLMPTKDKEAPRIGFAAIAGKIREVRLLGRWALFPLHTGDLTIGPMTGGVVARPQFRAPSARPKPFAFT